MTRPAEKAHIVVNGNEISNFESFAASYVPGGTPWASAAISVSEASSGSNAFFMAQKVKNEDQVSLILAGQPCFNEGIVVVKQMAFDARQHRVQLQISSKEVSVAQSSANIPGGQFKNYAFSAIAKALLKPLSIDIDTSKLSGAALKPFPFFTIQPGETVFEALHRAGEMRGIQFDGHATGKIVATSKVDGFTNDGDILQEGKNILSANASVDTSNIFWTTIGVGQGKGSDNAYGAAVSQVGAQSVNDGITRKTVRKFLLENQGTNEDAIARVNMDIAQQNLGMFDVSITTQGWLRSNGKLWTTGLVVVVKSDMLNLNRALITRQVQFNQGPQGTTTTLNLCLENGLQSPELQGAGGDGSDPLAHVVNTTPATPLPYTPTPVGQTPRGDN